MVQTITIDNVDECKEWIEPDILENLGRENFHGIYSTNEEGVTCGVMAWLIYNVDSPGGLMSQIIYFRSPDSMTARELLDEYTRQVRDMGVIKSAFELELFSDKERSVFESRGFKLEDKNNRLVYAPISNLAKAYSPKVKIPSNVVPLKELPLEEIADGIVSYLEHAPYKYADDIIFLPPAWYDGEVSCAVRRDGRVDGIFMIHRTVRGNYVPELFFAYGENPQKDLLRMLTFTFRKMQERRKEDEESYLKVERVNDNRKDLFSIIEDDLHSKIVTYGMRKEA